jgi:hypothetical protein
MKSVIRNLNVLPPLPSSEELERLVIQCQSFKWGVRSLFRTNLDLESSAISTIILSFCAFVTYSNFECCGIKAQMRVTDQKVKTIASHFSSRFFASFSIVDLLLPEKKWSSNSESDLY